MYNIERKDYGIKVTISGIIDLEEVNSIRSDIKGVLNSIMPSFSLLADLSEMIPATSEVKKIIMEVQTMCRKMGLVRAAVIVKSPVLKSQMIQSTFISGNFDSDRYINSSQNPDWEEQALRWILNSEEPTYVV